VIAQKADQLQTVLDDVLGSPSWRITAPLRKLKNALR
jgi:hypothetical protein